MDGFFGIGFGELVLIAIVALIVLGPERLPGAFREVAKFIRMLRNLSREFTDQFGDEFKALEDLDPRRMLQDAINDIDEEEKAKEESTKATNKKPTPKTTKPAANKTGTTKTASSTKAATSKDTAAKDTAANAKAAQATKAKTEDNAANPSPAPTTDQDATSTDVETTATSAVETSVGLEPNEEHQILPPASLEQPNSPAGASDAEKDASVSNGMVTEPAVNNGQVTDGTGKGTEQRPQPSADAKEHVAYTNGHVETSPETDTTDIHVEPHITSVTQSQKPDTTANVNNDSPTDATAGDDEAPTIGTPVQDEEKQS